MAQKVTEKKKLSLAMPNRKGRRKPSAKLVTPGLPKQYRKKEPIKELDDFYRDKWVLEYDRVSSMVGEGTIIKGNFTITKVEKVTGIGNGFMSVKGKMFRVAESDKYDVPSGKKQLSIYTRTGNDLRVTRVDQVLTENQLDKTLDKVRNNFFGKLGSIW